MAKKYLLLLLLAGVYSQDFAECASELTQILTKGVAELVPTDWYGQAASYSGLRVNSLGDFMKCNALEGAKYTLLIGERSYLSICGPSICTIEDYYKILGSLNFLPEAYKAEEASAPPYNILFPEDFIHENYNNLDSRAIVMVIVCLLIGLACVVGTTLDVFTTKVNKKTEEAKALVSAEETQKPDFSTYMSSDNFLKALLCFSVYTNFKKLVTSRSSEKTGEKNRLDLLNGVRVMSLCWVIMGHTFLMRNLFFPVYNYYDIADYFGYKKTALVYGGFYAVDTFFWISGLLMAYFFVELLARKDGLKVQEFAMTYLHRFIRLLPTYAFCLFFIWAFTKYMGYGPVWLNGDALTGDCSDYWWTNLMFLNNFIPDGNGNGCIGWSWYLANDMQFFMISPVILYFHHKASRWVGWGSISGLIVLNILSGVFISRHYDFSVGGPPSETQFQQLYTKPYGRCGAYAIGIACGLVLHSKHFWEKNKEHYDRFASLIARAFDNWMVRWVVYAMGAALINIFIFLQHSAWKDYTSYLEEGESPHDDWEHHNRYLWFGFYRILFILGLSCILLPILLGHGTLVFKFLSASVWTPLARISFATYLIHYMILYIIFGSLKTGYYLCDANLFTDVLTACICSFAAGLPISLMVESPFMGLERILLPSKK